MINAGANNPLKIVLVTSGQPSLNPRLVKEADALAENGYDVLVIYSFWNKWGTQMDDQILPTKKWNAVRAGGHPVQNPLIYFISRFIFKMSNIAVNNLRLNFFSDFAIARASFFLQKEAKKHKAALYIGHNLGGLPAVAKAAKKFNKPFGFDAEDLHRFEVSNDSSRPDVRLRSFIEDKYIPQTKYLTVSSDQIGVAYKGLFREKSPVTILNAFPKNNQIEVQSNSGDNPVKLFWFSQTIGANRGLDDIVKALNTFKSCPFELNLLGDIPFGAQSEYLSNLFKNASFKVNYYSPMPPDELTIFANQFDIGLALEPGFCMNNDFALSNKIFTYIQAGLVVIVTDTTAQLAFIKQHPAIGKVYKKGDYNTLAEILNYFYFNRDILTQTRQETLRLAHEKLNWETEQVKFLKLIEETV